MLKEEFRRAFLNPRFLIAMMTTFIALGIGLYDYTSPTNPFRPQNIPPQVHPTVINSYEAVIWAMEVPLTFFAPLIAVLPFAASYTLDRTSGYIDNILTRCTFKKYISSKFIINALVGGVVIALPLLILTIYTNFAYVRMLPALGEARIVEPTGPFSYLYRDNPDIYLVTVVVRSFIFGSIYSTAGLAISSFIDNSYVVLASPLLIYLLSSFILVQTPFGMWAPFTTFSPTVVYTASTPIIVTQLFSIFALGIGCIYLFARKEIVYT